MELTHTAFVLMPFDPEFQSLYEEMIVPSLEEVGFKVARADSFDNQQNILKDIVREIAGSDLIIADLTTLNPNVLYELGIAHGLNKPTVLLAQSIEQIPFDLRSYRILVYSTHFADVKRTIASLSQLAAKFKVGTVQFGNPVSDFLPAIATAAPKSPETATPIVVASSSPATDIENEGKGYLDWMVDVESAMQESTAISYEMGKFLRDFSESISQRTAQLEEAKRLSTPGSAAQMLNIAKAAASDLNTLADKLEARVKPFKQCWETIYEGTTGLLSSISVTSDEDRRDLSTFREQWATLPDSMKSAVESVRGFRESMSSYPNASRDIKKAVNRLLLVLDSIIAEFEHSHAFSTKVIALVDERIK